MVWKHRLSNYGCGALTALVSLALGGTVFAGYRALSGLVPWQLPHGWLVGLATFVALDLVYYLQHRAEHRSKWLWAFHSVHHQSKVCDSSVSFRTTLFAPLLILVPHLPLALLGVRFETYFVAYAVHAAAVFLLHSRTPKWFDRAGWVLNSPYLHRGHHSAIARLRGKNLGGVLIVWDRLFGTFDARCDEATTFGLGAAPTPLDPLRANWAPLAALLSGRRRASSRSGPQPGTT